VEFILRRRTRVRPRMGGAYSNGGAHGKGDTHKKRACMAKGGCVWQREVHMAKEAPMARGGGHAHSQGVRILGGGGTYVFAHNGGHVRRGAHVRRGRAQMPRGGCGAHMYVPKSRGAYKSMYGS
jgi:hypothetical protein